MAYGYEGLGLFYTVLEKLAFQEKPVKTSVLKTQLKVRKKLEKCWQFMEEIGIISTKNGETFNEKVLKNAEKYQEKKEKNAKKILQWREKQAVTKNVTGYVPVCNPPNISLYNNSIDNSNNSTTLTNSKRVNGKKPKSAEALPLPPQEIDLDFEKFNNWLQTNAPRVLKMKEPITIEQYKLLKEEFNDGAQKLRLFETFKAMHNWADLTKKNVSAYLTTLKWLEKDKAVVVDIKNGAARKLQEEKANKILNFKENGING